jgi:hypothetical protein
MEKFNLERALAGEPVCTRDGRDVTQLTYFKIYSNYQLWGVLNQVMYGWDLDGKTDNIKDTPTDLVMKPKENAIWVNLYKRTDGSLFVGITDHESEEAAKKEGSSRQKYIRTIKIVE